MSVTNQNKKFEKWAMPILVRLQKIILLEHFEPLKIEFGCKSKHAHAECQISYPYQSITFRYSKECLDDFIKDPKEVLPVLVHEMCHPLTDPLYDKAVARFSGNKEIEDERERLTDHIANIVLRNKLI